MKAGIFYTATGPIAVLTSHHSLTSPALVEKLRGKGIDMLLAWEVAMAQAQAQAQAQERYGSTFSEVMGDLDENDP